LSALFGDADSSFQARPVPQPPVVTQLTPTGEKSSSSAPQVMPLSWLQPGAYQPRRKFDEEAIAGLAESIRERGILQPLMVRPIEGEKDGYEILAGERRWRAAQRVGLHEVPVIVRPFSDREAMEIGLIENVQREGLTPLEEADGYRRLMDEFGHTHEALAKIIGKSRPHISNMLRLLNSTPLIKQMLDQGLISAGHARAVATAANPDALATEIARRGLSVRQAEQLVKKAAAPKATKAGSGKAAPPAPDADILALERELTLLLGLKVKISADGQAGSLTIHYRNLEQLEGVLQRLKGDK
jgi:ParB family chromosome partitioning protein